MKPSMSASLTVAAVLFSLAGSVAPGLAASPGFCSDYAHSAVREFYRAAHSSCADQIGGPRWHANFDVHYSWCLESSHESINSEWQARRSLLRQCGY